MPLRNCPRNPDAADVRQEARPNNRHSLLKRELIPRPSRAQPRDACALVRYVRGTTLLIQQQALIQQVRLSALHELGRLRLCLSPNHTRVTAEFKVAQDKPVTDQIAAFLDLQLARKQLLQRCRKLYPQTRTIKHVAISDHKAHASNLFSGEIRGLRLKARRIRPHARNELPVQVFRERLSLNP